MNPLFLLDTNTCIAYLRQRDANVINRVQARPPDELRLCSVVVAELYFGAFKSPQPAKNFSLLAMFLPVFLSLPFEDRAAKVYGQIRADLEAKGMPIGPNDCKAVVTVYVPRWPGVLVAATTYEIPIIDPEDLVRRALARVITVEKGIEINTPLADALEYFKDHYGIAFEIDKEACRRARAENMGAHPVGLPPQESVPTLLVLPMLLKDAGADYEIRGRTVYIVPAAHK